MQLAVTLTVEYDFVSAKDGSKHTVIAFGEAMDRGDKTTPKAMAAAFKYAAFQAFCIPTEGQEDADAQSHQIVNAPPVTQTQASGATPATPSVNAQQAAQLKGALEATGANVAAFCKHFNIQAVDQLGAAQFQLASRMLAKKKAKVASAADLNKQL